jgi:hypothetical protein
MHYRRIFRDGRYAAIDSSLSFWRSERDRADCAGVVSGDQLLLN